MKLSYQWLREWVSPRLDVRSLAERLTLAGLEVGAIEPVAPVLDGVVVAKVTTVSPHPSVDKLKVCDVEYGKSKNTRVVCGAPNVTVGMKAPLALPGAVLPSEKRIAVTQIQGVESNGMLCSAAELGLSEDASGLLVLDTSARVGASLVEVLALDDVTLEVDLTPNRGDCLSVVGIAREVAALTDTRMKSNPTSKVALKARNRHAIKLLAKKECPRYTGRVVTGVNTAAVTPMWMRERLRRAGVRSLHPVVDVTNYVMLELGQPMHAFDLDKLQGAIQIRSAGKSEKLTLLDGKNVTAPAGSLVIADNRGPIALAGVMGGLDTAVTDQTHSVFLESAFFEPATVARHARALGIQTESSQRFERGVDPELQRRALDRATALLLEIAGGTAGPVSEAKGKWAAPTPILLRRERFERIVGAEMPAPKVERALRSLGMKVQKTSQGWRVIPPSYRFDIRIEADLIEEAVRVIGYASVPVRLPAMPLAAPEVSESRVDVSRLRTLLGDRDYQEVITYSFVDPGMQQLLDPAQTTLALANPISADMAVMRTTLWPGLIRTLQYNCNRQQRRVRIYEVGRRFRPSVSGLTEEAVISGAAIGPVAQEQWGLKERGVDFYDAKGDVEALLALTGADYLEQFRFKLNPHPALHPGQSAAIHVGEEHIGWVGTLHPGLQARFELGRVVLFEIKLAALTQRRVPMFTEISKFPAIRRDLSIVVQNTTTSQEVVDVMKRVAGNLLVNLQLFDVYRGEGIDSGRKSLALGLTLQHSSRTLREAEVDALIAQVISTLTEEFGAELRR